MQGKTMCQRRLEWNEHEVERDGELRFKPPPLFRLETGDELIALAGGDTLETMTAAIEPEC